MDKPQTVAQETLGSRWKGQTHVPSPHMHLLYPTPSPGLMLPTVTLPPSSGSPGPHWSRDLRFPSCSWAGWAQRAPLCPAPPWQAPHSSWKAENCEIHSGLLLGPCHRQHPTPPHPPPHSAILRRTVGQLAANAASQL